MAGLDKWRFAKREAELLKTVTVDSTTLEANAAMKTRKPEAPA
jgi:hypothetical protein